MGDKFVEASKSLNKILRPIVTFYLNRLFDIEFDTKEIAGLKPPYIVIANHTNFWDPFFVSLCVPEPVYFVASDAYFRSRILKWILKYVGAIPKIKFVSDSKTIRGILDVCKHNGIIGIFPEGRRNWDGQTLPLRYATAKLIKSLGIPVVSILMEGACIAFPRWAVKPRKGKIRIKCSVLFDRENLKGVSADTIFERMTEALANDEYGRQKQQMHQYKGQRLAEKLELFLFACPECHNINTLESRNNLFACNACGYTVRYDEFGFFKSLPGGTGNNRSCIYDTPQAWNDWQLEYIENSIKERFAAAPGNDSEKSREPIFVEKDVLAQTGERFQLLRPIEYGTLSLFTDKLVFEGASGNIISLDIGNTNGSNIQFNSKFELYHNKKLYRFSRRKPCFSAYKWVKSIEIINKLLGADSFEAE